MLFPRTCINAQQTILSPLPSKKPQTKYTIYSIASVPHTTIFVKYSIFHPRQIRSTKMNESPNTDVSGTFPLIRRHITSWKSKTPHALVFDPSRPEQVIEKADDEGNSGYPPVPRKGKCPDLIMSGQRRTTTSKSRYRDGAIGSTSMRNRTRIGATSLRYDLTDWGSSRT